MASITPLHTFLKDIPQERQAVFKKLDAHIRKHAPKLKPYMEGNMLGYGKYHYKYDSGTEGDWFTVGLRNNKKTIAVYVITTIDGEYLTNQYTDKLKADIGKSCIRFKKEADIDWDVLAEIFSRANDAYEAV